MTDGQHHSDSPSPDSRPAMCDLSADTHVRPRDIRADKYTRHANSRYLQKIWGQGVGH
mgnify:FL=1